jgi:4-hydroxybenzoate polyprenyltransferase
MRFIFDFDEYICKKFDAFRVLVNNDQLWLTLIAGILFVCVSSAFLFGGLLGGLLWFLVSWQHMYLYEYWVAAKDKDTFNIKRNKLDSNIRVLIFGIGLISMALDVFQALLFVLALYMCSAHRIPPKKKQQKFVFNTLTA